MVAALKPEKTSPHDQKKLSSEIAGEVCPEEARWPSGCSDRTPAEAAASGRPDFRLGERLVFGNDKQFLPLQAADLYAWHVRRSLSPKKFLHSAWGKMTPDLEGVRTISRHVDEQRLVRFRSHMELGAAAFAAKNPNVQLLAYQGTAAQQRAARVAARAGRQSK